jgi:molybdopterin synthase catalytic subunit
MDRRVHSQITEHPLSTSAATEFVADPAAGAVVVFSGTVRDHSDGRGVAGLSYEAWADRAADGLAGLAREVGERWPEVRAVWLEHRVGDLAIGEPSVVVAVSAGHRPEAFEAARWAIDTLKETVPIWKKEHWSDGGAHWPGTPEA